MEVNGAKLAMKYSKKKKQNFFYNEHFQKYFLSKEVSVFTLAAFIKLENQQNQIILYQDLFDEQILCQLLLHFFTLLLMQHTKNKYHYILWVGNSLRGFGFNQRKRLNFKANFQSRYPDFLSNIYASIHNCLIRYVYILFL